MQKPRGTEDLARLLRRHVLGQAGLQRRRADAPERRDDAGEDHHLAAAGEGVAEVADGVEEDGGADDVDVEEVAAVVLLLLRIVTAAVIGVGFAAHVARQRGQHDDEAEDARAVDDAHEAARLERLPAEHVVRVDDDDHHAAHRHAEDDRVDGREEE